MVLGQRQEEGLLASSSLGTNIFNTITMSHHPGCPKNHSLYAICICKNIDLRMHTEALERNTLALAQVQEYQDTIAMLSQQLADKKEIIRKLTA